MRMRLVAALLAMSLVSHAQERSFIARFEPPAGAQVSPQETFTRIFHVADVPVTSVQSLRGTPLYVAIVMEGGKDRAFCRDLALRYVDWFTADPDLRGMMAVYAHNGLQSTALTTDYHALRHDISSFKPARGTQDAVWQGVLYAIRTLGKVGMDKPVRRLVLLIQDPNAYGALPASNGVIPYLTGGAPIIPQYGRFMPINVLKVLQNAQLYETVIAVEDHTAGRPILNRANTPAPAISSAHIDQIRDYSAGVVLSIDVSHGEQAGVASFHEQTATLARTLDALYRVTLTLVPTHPDGLRVRLDDQGLGAGVYPKILDVTPFAPPVAGAERDLVARVEPLMHSPSLLADTKFAADFDKRGGSLRSVESLKDAPLYVAIVVEAGTDPILYRDVPARYAGWFMKNPHLRGMMVGYAEDDHSKPRLHLRTRSTLGYEMTSNYSEVLKRIRSFSPSEPTPTFREVLAHACEELANQERGKEVRRLLFIVTHPSDWGPDLRPDELELNVEDSGIFVVAEDHSPHEQWHDTLDLLFGESNHQGPPSGIYGPWYSHALPWGLGFQLGVLTPWGFGYPWGFSTPWSLGNLPLYTIWLPTPWGFAVDGLKRQTAALFLRGEYRRGQKTADMFFEAQTRKLAEALDNLYWVRFVPPQTRHPNYEFSLHISDSGAHVHPQAVVLNFDPTCETDVRTLFGRCARK